MTKPLLPGTQTTSGAWGRIVSECLKDAGVDPKYLFEKVGLDYKESIKPDARVPDSKLRNLYPICEEATGISEFYLHLGTYVNAHSFHALGMAILVSKNVEDALHRFQRHGAIISDSGHIEIHQNEDQCQFEIKSQSDLKGHRLLPPKIVPCFFLGVANMMREITGDPNFNPLKVILCQEHPDNIVPYNSAFKCPIQYNQSRDVLIYDSSDIKRPVRYSNDSLARQHDEITEAFIQNMSPGFEDALYRQILKELPNGELSAEKLASRLNMSLRKLQNKLQSENTTYQQLLDKARMELAKKYLSNTHYSITEVTFLLGFASSASFCRAFKRWFDCSPSEYRQHLP